MVRRRGRRDQNHGDIRSAFEALGCTVVDLADQGDGFPDLAVGCMGVTHLVEVKNPDSRYGRAGLSATQTAFARDWRGGPVYVATSALEAQALVQNWRRRA